MNSYGVIYRRADDQGRSIFTITKLIASVCVESTQYGEGNRIVGRQMQLFSMDEIRKITEALNKLVEVDNIKEKDND